MKELMKLAAEEAYSKMENCLVLDSQTDDINDLKMYIEAIASGKKSEVEDDEAIVLIKRVLDRNEKVSDNLNLAAKWIRGIKDSV